jgi:hypothetical protein
MAIRHRVAENILCHHVARQSTLGRDVAVAAVGVEGSARTNRNRRA